MLRLKALKVPSDLQEEVDQLTLRANKANAFLLETEE